MDPLENIWRTPEANGLLQGPINLIGRDTRPFYSGTSVTFLVLGLLHIDTQDPDLIQRLIILICLDTFDRGADIHSLGDSPKDSMLVV